MSKLFQSLTNIFRPAGPIASGVYTYQTPENASDQYRLHLRINESGEGLLIVNASTVLHLNQTATEHVYHLVQGTSPQEAAKAIANRYQIDPQDARLDFLEIKQKITSLIEVPDLDPTIFFDFSRQDPYSGAVNAPYRLDCAVTYNLPDSSSPDLAPQRRVDRELTTQEWVTIIDKAWDAGIPQIIFTGGEATTRLDLIQLLNHAENNGQVTGLLTDGHKFLDSEYLNQLLLSGLDHLMFVLNPLNKNSWTSLQKVLVEDLFTTVHLTINQEILAQLPRILQELANLETNAVSLSVSEPGNPAFEKALSAAQTQLAEAGLQLKWDLPVPYSNHNPVSIELAQSEDPPVGAGKAWLYIEPDGDVLPTQGVNKVLGNFLTDSFEEIWQNALSNLEH
jgi:hypothetical protein